MKKRAIMENNQDIMKRFLHLKFKSEKELEKILQEDLQEIMDLRETISIYEIKKERLEILQTEKNEILRLLNEERKRSVNWG